MNEQEVLRVLGGVGAIVTNSHVVYNSGKHGTTYINKDAIYLHPRKAANLYRAIAEQFANDNIEVVIAPAVGGIILAQWIAYYLSEITGREVLSIYAEKAEQSLFKAVTEITLSILTLGLFHLRKSEELVIKKNGFVIKRDYNKFIFGKNILAVEDVMTTGSSVKKVIKLVRTLGGNIIGLGVLYNRGEITPQDVAKPPKLFALINMKLDAWDETKCPLCAKNVPINVNVGKGREYLARKKTRKTQEGD